MSRVRQPRKPPRRFGSYAAIEAGNAVLLPALALWIARPVYPAEIAAMALAIIAVAGFLVVGARYWHALDARLKGSSGPEMRRALAFADRAEVPLLACMALSLVATGAAFAMAGWSAPVVAAAILILLAALEYVNYYRWQLQHFDRWSDFVRLITTGRMRRAHMARDLAAYRRPTR